VLFWKQKLAHREQRIAFELVFAVRQAGRRHGRAAYSAYIGAVNGAGSRSARRVLMHV